ncbi:SUMF1/EgtB/PvdO family nonheme iron enzyme [Nostoc sp. UCD121]|uniref:SUMF1/EgtB/PvdO family nonheme iron enzyme n=1 Tax=unclassified Nostoc TaxID=2593658 RepID=UPI00162A3396|nr:MULTISPECIES: SUMF1/EgtB/PvdO family nonheme iron enzyme [unclassified Nostoc]MBC1224911.1 SUMF1/EgtB/PvdO family nonheme iron enzyme [Nostoc sp. UCD120]MBC1281131.1 SUMF1/EgtB/PvdO family nonheme iron enzyme [Nostoc sp. UCD121]MBC1299492.1 SUMF1/EgtB/PvdO family nonheme iron enzyme [Nostoc sp. UCD122]
MGKNWAIVVGINNYDNLQALNYAKRDAEAMKAWFENEAQFDQVFLFTEDSPAIKTNPPIPTQPFQGRFKRFLNKQFEEALLKAEDNLWFFFAGHGKRYVDQDYLMFLDSDPTDPTTAISIDYVTQRLRRCGADNVVLLIDACRDEGDRSGLGVGAQEQKGVITFYSCAPSQKSWEIDELQHGSFTYSLLEGLRIQEEANCATVERLEQHLRYRVPEVNADYKKPEQNPYLKAEPPYKMYYILIEQAARIKDAEPLKYQASLAENEGDLLVAEQLWIRVLAVSRADRDAIRAIKRIAQRQVQDFNSISETLSITQPVASPGGGRAVALEPTSIRKDDRPVFKFDVVTVNAQGQEIKCEQGQAEYFTETFGNGMTLDMVLIPAGSFMMGSPEDELERRKSEIPQHSVTIQQFCMSKYPVTQAQWKAVAALAHVNRELQADPSEFKGEQLPVEQVSWYDAVEFCDRLSSHTKRQYRLPSEAEWEYACRAGTTTPFHFGETITTDVANYRGTDHEKHKWFLWSVRGPKGIYRQEIIPVGSFEVANVFGLYDMHGNVGEWCLDDWHASYEGAPTDGSPWFDENGNFSQKQESTVLRGGSWVSLPSYCRSAFRYSFSRGNRSNDIGFRIVCAAGRILQ